MASLMYLVFFITDAHIFSPCQQNVARLRTQIEVTLHGGCGNLP